NSLNRGNRWKRILTRNKSRLSKSRVPSPLNLRDGLKSVFSVAVPCSLLWISFLSVL
ncbi:hypothetical protein BgiBS90_027899, partial [Biomphalaria glabrata]